MTVRRLTSPLWFAAPLLAVYAATFFIVEVLPQASAPGAVAVGMTADLVILVPALYYVVLVRGRGWPAITLAPVFLLSFGLASLIVPAEHQSVLRAIGYALPAVELALVGYVGHKAWRVVRANREASAAGGDFYDRVREALRGAFDVPAVAGALAYEVSLFHYAFLFRRTEPPVHSFAYHRRSGYGAVFAAVLMVAAVELVAVHLLLQAWSETAAFAHAALSLYGIIWLIGDYRAMRSRPHELGVDGLRLRYGLRWDLAVAWRHVAGVSRTRQPAPGDDYLSTVPVGSPQYVVELHMPLEATGPYGVARSVRRIGLVVDEPEAFEGRLRSLGIRLEP
ncbi:MAG: hypothetical protein AAGI91_09710 [Bacteroidota bacterium]